MVSPFWDAETMMKWLANAARCCFRRLGQSCKIYKYTCGLLIEYIETIICRRKSNGQTSNNNRSTLTTGSLTSLEEPSVDPVARGTVSATVLVWSARRNGAMLRTFERILNGKLNARDKSVSSSEMRAAM